MCGFRCGFRSSLDKRICLDLINPKDTENNHKYNNQNIITGKITAIKTGEIKMIKHIVMFRVKDKNDCGSIKSLIESMRGRVKELKNIEVGINEIEAERNYDIMLTAEFESWDDLKKYSVNEYHVNTVIAGMKEKTTGSVACDYDTDK